MQVFKTPIEGVLVIEPRIFPDDRGYFYESYSKEQYEKAGIGDEFVQDNQSFSQVGSLRGLHGQAPPFAQGKLVRVLRGRVWDVVVDIRYNSPSYGQHFGIELSGENHKQLWIPPGFVHGFITLENDTIFSYKVTKRYDKASEIGIIWNDPTLGIPWPIDNMELLISEKDKVLPGFNEFKTPF